jgi:alkanesulfonate monooxygenase SsuD/methylene tetrahydromethanopterin reductase-like flavin-dependent oxidoreductase (luciferase family)
MLDAAVVMGAVATVTTTLKLGTSVLISPYRGPLNDVRQFATVDVLSGGRLILGVGAGWMVEEFEALGLEPRERGPRTVEAIEIYKRAWTDRDVSFDGEYYQFSNISMDPKPIQDIGEDGRPRICTGSSERILEDLARFAEAGYSMMVAKIVCPSGEVSELREHIQQIGDDIIPAAQSLQPAGGWLPEL